LKAIKYDAVNTGIQTAVKLAVYENIWTDQDACVVHYYNPNTTQISWNTTYITVTGSGVGSIGNWANKAVAFKAAAVATVSGVNKRRKLEILEQ
jgi:hypothetical protein